MEETQAIAAPADSTDLAIETRDLERVYRRGQQAVRALDGVDLEIGAAQFVAIKGRSGSGKTTLLNCISGLDQPTAGTVHVYGQEIGRWPRVAPHNVAPRAGGLHLPVVGLAAGALGLRECGAGATSQRRGRQGTPRCHSRGAGTGRPDQVDRPPALRTLRRAAAARGDRPRAGIEPRLLIADEPTGNLDSKTAHSILALFRSIVRERNVTMLMATHDTLADDYVDRIINLSDGRIISG